MTDDPFARILEREWAATEGPWVRWSDLDGLDGFVYIGDEAGNLTAENPSTDECNPVAKVYTDDDADFIAEARTEIPILLAAIADRDARIANLEAADWLLSNQQAILQKERDHAWAIAEGLEAKLEYAMAAESGSRPTVSTVSIRVANRIPKSRTIYLATKGEPT